MIINIKTKLIGGFVTVITLMVVVLAIGWNGLNSLGAAADHIVHERLPDDAAIRDLELQLAPQGELYMEYPLTGEEEFLHEAQEKTNLIMEEEAHLEMHLARELELLGQFRQLERDFTELNRQEEFVNLYTSGAFEEAMEHLHLVTAEGAQMEEELAGMAHEIELGMEDSFDAGVAARDRALKMMIAVTVVTTVIGLSLAFLLSRKITSQLVKVSNLEADGVTDAATESTSLIDGVQKKSVAEPVKATVDL